MSHLHDLLVLITGCSSGIGRALALEFGRAGHRVVATARNPDSLAALAGERTLTLRLDVTDAASVRAAVSASEVWGSGIDILVNNAGFALIGPVAELEPAALRRQLDTNLVGLVELIQEAVPHMAKRGSGRIVNIGSVSGITATPFAGAYCASKAAVHLMTDALRMELAPFSIRVIEVQPGAIASSLAVSSQAGLSRYRRASSLYRVMADAIEARARLSQNRPTAAEDLARVVVERVTRRRPPLRIRFGRGSRLLPLVGLLPARLRDQLLRRRFGVREVGKVRR